MASIKQHLVNLEVLERRAIQVLLEAAKDDIDNLIADVTELDSTIDTLVAKMNLDAGITGVDYAGAAAMTSGTANLEA